MASSALPSLALSFVAKKSAILHDLSTPASSYEDASPKGSVDTAIVELIDEINKLDGFVTTSSCAGRISVFVEGKKKSEDRQVDEDLANDVEGRGQSSQDKETIAGTGGKGGGGKWLYVSHDPFTFEDGQDLAAALGMSRKREEEASWEGQRLVRFKFEPMVRYSPSMSCHLGSVLSGICLHVLESVGVIVFFILIFVRFSTFSQRHWNTHKQF
jgi:tRNA wybutosine-synthesizing protein 3